MARDNAQALAWREIDYQPSWRALEAQHSEKEIRAEYTRLRHIAKTRLEVMAKSEFIDTQMYKRYSKEFPKLRDIKSKSQIAQELSLLSRFIAAKTSTVTGMRAARKAQIESLKEHGYGFVNKKNFNAFTDFMGAYHNQKLEKSFISSGSVMELFQIAENRKIDPKILAQEFKYFIDNRKALRSMDLTAAQQHNGKRLKTALDKQLKTDKGKKGKKR